MIELGDDNKMAIYIALLRGINVGSKNRIKMVDLKHLFESMGFSRVETYINSGNVIFESSEKEDTLQKKIEYELEKMFCLSIAVILRTAAELKQIIFDCPFSEEEVKKAESANEEGESLYVSLLTQYPLYEKIKYLNTIKSGKDEYRIKNRDIYLLFCHSIRNSKLANNLHKLEIPATVRNWKTMNKLYSLVKNRTENG